MNNFPKRKNRHIRGIVVAPKGYVIVCADYSQIEFVCLGVTSGDKNLKAAHKEGHDIHLEKAKEIYGLKKAPENRQKAKHGLVFPVCYGAGSLLVSRNLDIPVSTAERHIERFWKEYGRVREWQFETVDFYNENHYVESRSGRRRYGPLTRNQIFNTPVQGLAQDFSMNAMIILVNRGYWVWLNLYDELGMYVPEKDLERHLVRISRVLTTLPEAWVDDVQVSVGLKIGYDWANLEKVEV